jgi:16S rRNA pseudouridine516 synthase
MPGDLPEGEWRWLYPDDLVQLGKSVEALSSSKNPD